ncbi:concanavalin A-like lectin/glucanase domain-containing protein [Diplogelasinospora grovesii]|uniref:Concanavalin A-like lectin/glucanase domain-containing protein n=1 Tax=Diplogelasinospora grovesii TaxID=303347 RepID=A0AAN6N2H0_9PEZI|nr:concanavalin A-like lectin/glucanase domain-containing protein [Diplogelasinospora grovesii]
MMKFLTLSSGLLSLTAGVLADINYQIKGYNIHTGQEHPVSTHPITNISSSSFVASKSASVQARADISYSGNWCGASQNPPSGSSFTNVFGIWNVVSVSPRSGQADSDHPVLCQWVGIDGTGACDGLLQCGQFSQINDDGSQSNFAFWEYIPGPAMSIDNFPINAGDNVAGNVTVTSSTSGIMEVINYTTGLGVIVTVSGGGGTLCGQSAEWILEDPSSNGLLPFPNYNTATYFAASATMNNGASVGFDGSTDIYLVSNNSIVCQAAEDSNGNLVVTND